MRGLAGQPVGNGYGEHKTGRSSDSAHPEGAPDNGRVAGLHEARPGIERPPLPYSATWQVWPECDGENEERRHEKEHPQPEKGGQCEEKFFTSGAQLAINS